MMEQPGKAPRLEAIRLNSDFWIGAGFATLAALGILIIPIEVGPYTSGRSMLPLIGACSCLGFAIALAVRALRGSDAPEPADKTDDADVETEAPMTMDARVRLAAVFVLVAIHALLLNTLGLGITGISLQILLFLVLGVRNPLVVILVPVANIALIHLLISELLGVPLPEGQLLRWAGF